MNFDEQINRFGTHSVKWDMMEKTYGVPAQTGIASCPGRGRIAVTPVRLSIEIVVLAIGWLLGGTVGVGTVLFALLIGPSVGYGLKLVGWIAGAREEMPPGDVHPELEA